MYLDKCIDEYIYKFICSVLVVSNIIVLVFDKLLLVYLEYKEDIFTIGYLYFLNILIVFYHILIDLY
jgi:hypothetical protein